MQIGHDVLGKSSLLESRANLCVGGLLGGQRPQPIVHDKGLENVGGDHQRLGNGNFDRCELG